MVPPTALPTISLMQATEVGQPFHREGWVYEEKYDGWRMVVYKDGTAVRLVSRAGKEHSRRFPDLVAVIRALPPATLILDGEVAIFDDRLISRFEWFRKRPEDVSATPPIYMAFDCLYRDGHDLRAAPLRDRRAELEGVLENDAVVLFPARRLATNGLEAWAQVLERGYEGMVGKEEASPYRGGRTLSWLKVRQPNYREGERGWSPRGSAVHCGLPGCEARRPSRSRACCSLWGAGIASFSSFPFGRFSDGS